jgi:phage host-nuclease inhibitor protein Gam
MPETKTKPMTATERKELRRIIGARFELLDQELAQRRTAIRSKIENDLRESKAKDIAQYEAKLKEFAKEAEKLNDKADALWAEIRAAGLTTGGRTNRYSSGSNNWQYATQICTVNVARNLEVADIKTHVDRASQELFTEHGAAKLDLHKMQLQIEEELAVGALISEQAQSFLERIPQASALLPAPETVKAPALPSGG